VAIDVEHLLAQVPRLDDEPLDAARGLLDLRRSHVQVQTHELRLGGVEVGHLWQAARRVLLDPVEVCRRGPMVEPARRPELQERHVVSVDLARLRDLR